MLSLGARLGWVLIALLSNVMKKRQYWVKEGPSWKIIYEGAG